VGKEAGIRLDWGRRMGIDFLGLRIMVNGERYEFAV
jgi:hypothetical protein